MKQVVNVVRRVGRGGPALRTFGRAFVDQARMHASSPIAIFSTVAMPCVFAFVAHNAGQGHGSARTTSDLAVGSAGIGILDGIIVLVVLSFVREKQWRTLYAALGSPGGLVPVVAGRLSGIAVQSLTSLPGTLAVLAVFWGVDRHFAWWRWIGGGVLLAVSTVCVIGLLGFAVLRYPYSAGMTNGLTGVVLALSALVVPQRVLPGPLRAASFLLPQAYVMNWVRGGGPGQIAAAVALTAAYAIVVVLAIRRLERVVRRQALALEA